MNIIIKELAQQQAGSILMDLVMPDSGRPERVEWNIGCTTEHLEQFADLIVSEFVKDPVAWTRADVNSPILHEEMMQKYPELRQYFPVPLYYAPLQS